MVPWILHRGITKVKLKIIWKFNENTHRFDCPGSTIKWLITHKLLQNDIHSTCCYTSKNQWSVLCASSIVDLDLQLGLTTAFGLKVPIVSSGSIMPSVSEISSSCLGSVDSLRWRSLAKFSRGVGPSCLSSHAPGHSGRDSRGSIGLEVSKMADGSFWREDKQEDVGGTSVASWDATGIIGSSISIRAGIWVWSCLGLADSPFSF